MVKLILFEMKKVIKSTYFFVMLLLLTIFVSCYFVYNYIHTERVEDLIAHDEEMLAPLEKRVSEYESAIEAGEMDADAAKTDMVFWKKQIDEYQTKIYAAENHDWETLLDFEIAIGEDNVKMFPTQAEHNTTKWPTNFTMAVYFERNSWLKKHNIEPVFPIHLFSELTAYDLVFDSEIFEESIGKFSDIHSSAAVYFLYLFNGLAFGIFGVGFFLFLFGDIVAKEGLGRQGSIYFLYTQPLRRGNVLVSKFIALILMTLFILISASVFSLLLGTVFDRFGALNYPVLIYEPEFLFRFMPMGTFIAWSALLFFMVLVFSYAILFFFSVLAKRTSMAIGLTIATIVLGVILSGQAIQTTLAAYNPFNYFQIRDIITMEFALMQRNFDFSLANGVLALGITSLFILAMTYAVARLQLK